MLLCEIPGNGPPRGYGEFGEAQIVERFLKNPLMQKVGGVLYTALPHLVLPPLPLCHFIFLLSPRTSRFICASTTNPKTDLRDGAEEGSWEPEEGSRRSQP